MNLLALLLACGQPNPPTGEDDAETCNETECREELYEVEPDFRPYGWCTTVIEEIPRVEGTWSCTSDDENLDEDVVLTVTVSDSDPDDLHLTTVRVNGLCIEMIWYPILVTVEGAPVFSTEIASFAEVWRGNEGDVTFAYDELISRASIEGTLFEDLDYEPSMRIFSRDDIGAARESWRLNLGYDEPDRYSFTCN